MTRQDIRRILRRAARGNLGPRAFLEAKRQLLPKALYRYIRLPEACLTGIRSSTITLRRADAQNDPFDSAFCLLDERTQRTVIDSMITVADGEAAGLGAIKLIALEKLLQLPGGGPEWVRRQRNAVSICSFSERSDSLLLWSHYAGGHTGLCVEYPTSGPDSEELSQSLYPVIYQESFADVTEWLRWFDGTSRGLLFLLHAAMIKSTEWSYEREWRSVRSPADLWINNEPPMIIMPSEHLHVAAAELQMHAPLPSAIILGARASGEIREQVVALGGEMGFEVRQAQFAPASFHLQITAV